MIAEITAAFDAIKALSGFASTVSDAAKQHAIQQATISLMQSLITVQQQASAMAAENDELRKRAAEIDKWLQNQGQYLLQQVGPGVFAHVLQPPDANPEARVKLCAHCYTEAKHSILQLTREPLRMVGLECPRCKTKSVFTHLL